MAALTGDWVLLKAGLSLAAYPGVTQRPHPGTKQCRNQMTIYDPILHQVLPSLLWPKGHLVRLRRHWKQSTERGYLLGVMLANLEDHSLMR